MCLWRRGWAGMNNESISWELHYWMASPSDHPIYWCMTRKRKNSQDILYICITDMIFRFQILTKVTFSSAMRDSFNCIQLLHSDISEINPWSSINMGTSEDHQMSCFRRPSNFRHLIDKIRYTSRRCLFLIHAHIYKGRSRRSCQWMATAENYCHFSNNNCDEKDIEEESSHLSNSIR